MSLKYLGFIYGLGSKIYVILDIWIVDIRCCLFL